MPITVLVGAQWGDEGKGRVADRLAADSQIVARYAGGDNAGHTVTVGDKTFRLHLLPSGVLHANVLNVIGAGTVINPPGLIGEVDDLAAAGVKVTPDQLAIDRRAHIITPAHIYLDAASEAALGTDAIGTTKRGIGPAYSSKTARTGIRAGAMRDPEAFGDLVQKAIVEGNKVLTTLYNQPPIDKIPDKVAMYVDAARRLAPYLKDVPTLLADAIDAQKRILAEGAQGTLLDLDHGQYPYVTSSSPSVGGVLTGLGVPPQGIDRVVGVIKSFSTRVGSGPFPTELTDALGDRLRGTGDNAWDEYGTTTGRPRRCGWLDIVLLRYAARLNGFTELVMNKLDILSGIPTLSIAVAYEIDGQHVTTMPDLWEDLARVKPVYETLPGWTEPLMGKVHTPADLPPNALAYVKRIEALVGVPITSVGVGPERDQVLAL